MNLRTLLILSGCLVACGKLEPKTAGLGEACFRTLDCADPFLCTDGKCALAAERACEAGARRCNGDVIETCRAAGDGFDPGTSCVTGCVQGTCRPAACEAGTRKCEGSFVLECLPSGAGFVFFQSCSTSCDATTSACAPQTCVPYESRCKPGVTSTLQTCNPRGTGWTDAPCSTTTAPGTCTQGHCEAVICASAGGESERRCHGEILEECSESRTSFDVKEICEFGCAVNGAVSACAPPACAAGEERCDGQAIVRCTPDRRSLAFVQFCTTGCTLTGTKASCVAPVCTPLARRCAAGTTPIVEQCRPDGSGFDTTESCTQSCVSGNCVVTDSQCTPGERRCQGREAEVCVRIATGATEWRFEERCLGLCSNGACEGASCGCAGGGGIEPKCGDPARQPIQLKAAMSTSAATAFADGNSTFLFLTETITGVSGDLVPEGTFVTFTHDGDGALFASADADPAHAGLQRPTRYGRADVLLRAPSSARTVVVTATIAGRCSGTASLKFDPAVTTGTRIAFVAEDFSTTTRFDRSSSTGTWDAASGRLLATPVFSLGSGVDGDLSVTGGATRDLWDEGYVRGWNVVTFGDSDAIIETPAQGLAPGDEVLILTVTGTATSQGTYEFQRVAAAAGNRITFADRLRSIFGNGSNQALSGHRVVVQRVAQFTTLTIDASSKVVARSLVSGGSGVLPIRVRGAARIAGGIRMDEAGLPAGSAQVATSTTGLNRLLHGSGATKAGGGIVFVAAGTLQLKADGSSSYTGTLSATSSGGAGGTVWAQGGTVNAGTDRITAAGVDAANAGRIRIDAAAVEGSVSGVPASAVFFGQNGPAVVQSTSVWAEQPSGPMVRSVTLLGVIGGSGKATFGTLALVPGVTLEASADGGANWATLDVSRTFAAPGRAFRYRVRLSTVTDAALEVSGIAFRLELN